MTAEDEKNIEYWKGRYDGLLRLYRELWKDYETCLLAFYRGKTT